jgi:hypothetical protein
MRQKVGIAIALAKGAKAEKLRDAVGEMNPTRYQSLWLPATNGFTAVSRSKSIDELDNYAGAALHSMRVR